MAHCAVVYSINDQRVSGLQPVSCISLQMENTEFLQQLTITFSCVAVTPAHRLPLTAASCPGYPLFLWEKIPQYIVHREWCNGM